MADDSKEIQTHDGTIHVVPTKPRLRSHVTYGGDCWCKAEVLQPCPECEDTQADPLDPCWRCNGRGLVEPYADDVPRVIIHDDTGAKKT